MDDFQELEQPDMYINDNGRIAGWVVRVDGLDRSLMLNNDGKIQSGLSQSIPTGNSNPFAQYHTTALFPNGQIAWDAASKYYRDHGMVYPYAIVIDTRKLYPEFVYRNGTTIDTIKKVAEENNWDCESQKMKFT